MARKRKIPFGFLSSSGIDRGTYDGKSIVTNGSTQKLDKTFSSAGDQKTITVWGWLKQVTPSGKQNDSVFSTGTSELGFGTTSHQDKMYCNMSGVWSGYASHVHRDTGDFELIMFTIDTTESTDTDRIKMFRGNQQLTITTEGGTLPTLNANTVFNGAAAHTLFGGVGYLATYCAGLGMCEQALSPTDVGHVSADTDKFVMTGGVPSVTYGTNGFYFDFDDTRSTDPDSSTTIYDQSGNNNDWTFTNGSADAFVSDTPVDNHATLNALDEQAGTLSNGNLTLTNMPSALDIMYTTFPIRPNTGKWYWEHSISATPIGGGSPQYQSGLCTDDQDKGGIEAESNCYGYLLEDNLTINVDGTKTDTTETAEANDLFLHMYDSDTGNYWLGWYDDSAGQEHWFDSSLNTHATSEPDTDTDPTITISAANAAKNLNVLFGVRGSSGNLTANFGASGFSRTIPTNAKPLSSANLPTDDVDFFPQDKATGVLATGTNIESDLATARSGWSTNYVDIIKDRDTSEVWYWRFSHDSSNEYDVSTTASYGAKGSLSGSEDHIGYTLKVDSLNCFAGSVSHTNGGGDTSVSYSASTARQVVMLFSRSGGEVIVYHPELTSGYLINLTDVSVEYSSSLIKNVSASGFDIDSTHATATYDYLVLVEGDVYNFSKYVGNGSADGTFIPSDGLFASIKKRFDASTEHWSLVDTLRDTYNPTSTAGSLAFNLPNAETADASRAVDFVSNGDKIRTSAAAGINTSGGSYLTIDIKKNGGSLAA